MKNEELIKFYQTYKLYIFPVIVVLSCLFLIIFAIVPQTIKLMDNQKSKGELLNKAQLLETKALALESYNEKDLAQKIDIALNSYPQDKDYGNIIGILQQLTSISGFNITAISFSGESKQDKNSSYHVKVEISGPKALFQTLLDNLENSPRLLNVDSIDISANTSTDAINASLAIKALYSKLPQSFGSEDSPLPQISGKNETLLVNMKKVMDTNSVFGLNGAQVASPKGKSNPFE